jgi:hypothetical protein
MRSGSRHSGQVRLPWGDDSTENVRCLCAVVSDGQSLNRSSEIDTVPHAVHETLTIHEHIGARASSHARR